MSAKSSPKILLVDDDRFYTRLLVRMLAKIGITDVEVAQHGEEALTHILNGAQQGSPEHQLIILDINMPFMTGWELLDKLENLVSFTKNPVPIVMVTTSRNEDDKFKASEHKLVKEFLVKPVSELTLLNMVQSHLKYTG